MLLRNVIPETVIPGVSQSCVAVVQPGLSCLQRSANQTSVFAESRTPQEIHNNMHHICVGLGLGRWGGVGEGGSYDLAL